MSSLPERLTGDEMRTDGDQQRVKALQQPVVADTSCAGASLASDPVALGLAMGNFIAALCFGQIRERQGDGSGKATL